MAAIVLIPYLFRFGGRRILPVTQFLDPGCRRKMMSLDGWAAGSISLRVRSSTAFPVPLPRVFHIKLVGVSALLCLFFFYKHKFARYILAAFLVLGLGVFPYACWLLGTFTTPFQLWRLTWLMPFGLGLCFLDLARTRNAFQISSDLFVGTLVSLSVLFLQLHRLDRPACLRSLLGAWEY